ARGRGNPAGARGAARAPAPRISPRGAPRPRRTRVPWWRSRLARRLQRKPRRSSRRTPPPAPAMIALSTATRVFAAPGATDMRKSFNGLYALVRHQLDADPLSGHLFVFCNRSRNRLKILAWDG